MGDKCVDDGDSDAKESHGKTMMMVIAGVGFGG